MYVPILDLAIGKEEPQARGFAEINGINGINGRLYMLTRIPVCQTFIIYFRHIATCNVTKIYYAVFCP